MIHDSEDCIISGLLRKPGDQVHSNLLKWECAVVCCYVIKGCLLFVCDDFVLLTVCASFYVIRYPLTHSDPLPYFSGFSDGFISTWVSCCGVIVDDNHQLAFFCFGGCGVDGVNEQFWL